MPNAPQIHRPLGAPAKRVDDRRLSACERGYDRRWGKHARAFIADQFAKGQFRCADCGRLLTGDRRDIHVDHKIPHNGQADPLFWDYDNLQLLHRACHSRKTAKHDGGFGHTKSH